MIDQLENTCVQPTENACDNFEFYLEFYHTLYDKTRQSTRRAQTSMAKADHYPHFSEKLAPNLLHLYLHLDQGMLQLLLSFSLM